MVKRRQNIENDIFSTSVLYHKLLIKFNKIKNKKYEIERICLIQI